LTGFKGKGKIEVLGQLAGSKLNERRYCSSLFHLIFLLIFDGFVEIE